MGQLQCCSPAQAYDTDKSGLVFTFGEDNAEAKILHEDHLLSKVEELTETMRGCEIKLKQSLKLFKDNSMRSDPIILSAAGQENQHIKCTFERPYVFLTDPTAIRGKPYRIIDRDEYSPSRIVIKDEILQYFGVFICFLSKNTNLINQIILTQPNSYGLCALKMNIGTRQQYIFIDDYVLCCDKKPLFCQPINGSYMWPCLLQRAWFKVKGNITDKIQKNTPEEVYSFFLSYPLKTYPFSPQDYLQNKNLLRKKLHGIQSTMGCFITSKKQPLHKLGLSGRKFYFLIKVIWFEGKMLYYLRNPCGLFDFRGSLRLMSQQLQARIRKETGDAKIPQGNFLLDEEEFIEQIESFSIIYYLKYSSVISEAFLQSNSNQQIFIRAYIQSQAIVSLSFEQRGGLAESDLIYAPITYQVISLNDDTLVGGNNNQEGCFGVKTTRLLDEPLMKLKAGEYLIRIKKKQSRRGPIILTSEEQRDKIIATAPFVLKFDNESMNKDLNDRFYQFLRAMGKRQLKVDQGKLTRTISQSTFWLGDLAVLYVQKTKQNQQSIRLEVYFPEVKNLQCISHKIDKQFTALPAFTSYQLIVFQKIDPAEQTVLGKYVIEPF